MKYRASTILFILATLVMTSGIVVADSNTATQIPNEADVSRIAIIERCLGRQYGGRI